MPRTKIILNPNAGKGYGATLRPDLEKVLRRLGVQFDLVETTHTGHAIELASEAVLQGYETIAAVGGDGTTNEVVNGMMAVANQSPMGTLACIPAGSGNDFAVMNGTATNLEVACQAIAAGQTQVIDLGRVKLDGTIERYFDNAVGTGFDVMTGKYGDMFAMGIADPLKVVRSALENAASIAGLLITTETVVVEKKQEEPAMPPQGGGGMGGGMPGGMPPF